MAANRINRINEEMKREMGSILRELKDPRIPLMTSVVAAEVTQDLRFAKIYVSVLGDENVQKEALVGLKKAAGFVRREVGRRLNLRITPEIQFALDHSIEHGAHINELLTAAQSGRRD
ncbi:MAG: 30S ribosome-binding factor RbfA [Clostridia bacterium]|nr:30S ribosome-binding factor RbfA [Clostridia bacterium]